MPAPPTIIIGNKRSTAARGFTKLGVGEILAYIPNEIAANCWMHTVKVWMGRATTTTGWARPILYSTSGSNGSDGPTSLLAAFEPIIPETRMYGEKEGKVYTSQLWNGLKGQKGLGGAWIALSLHGLVADTNVGRTPAADISGDNERFYHRYDYLTENPPSPMGVTSTEWGIGWMVMWVEADQNLAPLEPARVSPSGYVGTITPTIAADFRDPNGANGDGIDRGDRVSATLVQVRKKSDLTTCWNVEYAASEAERAANRTEIVYGSIGSPTTLVRGTTYQVRVAHKDDFGALGTWSSWIDFTPVSQGLVTIGTNPAEGKVDALQPSVDVVWTHQTGLSTNAVRVQYFKGAVLVRDSGTISRSIANGASDTLSWATLGLTGQLEDGAPYTVVVLGRDTTNIWSGPSQPRAFTTDKAPGIPNVFAPEGNVVLPNTSYPTIWVGVNDPDDAPADLVVKLEILTQLGALIVTRTMIWDSRNVWRYQTTAADLAAIGDYKVRAYAGDGYLWSGVQTVEASAVRSTEALFRWQAVPAVTLTAPASSATLNDETPDVSWTIASQDKYRVRALDAVTGAEVYTTGWVADAATRAHAIPVGWVRNGNLLNIEIGVESGGLQGFAVATNVLISYTPPPTLANFTVLPETIGNEPFATSARIAFDPYTGANFAGYVIERSDLSRPLILETDVSQTVFSDYHAPSQAVVYTGRVIEARGIDEYVMSDPVIASLALDLRGVALVSLSQPVTHRYVTLQHGKRAWNLTGEEETYLPRGSDAPIAKTGRARWQEGTLDLKLRQELGDPEADRLALEALARSGTGFSYRDRVRRLWLRIPVDGGLDIEDRLNDEYDVSLKVRTVLHVEGIS